MEISRLIDNDVRDRNGNLVGTIDELILCRHSGRISHVVIARSDHRVWQRVPWNRITINTDAHGFVLRDPSGP